MADKRTGNEGAIHLTAYDNIFALQELMSHQLCRFAGGVLCTKIMMARPTAGHQLQARFG
jgi:hypothetical protein